MPRPHDAPRRPHLRPIVAACFALLGTAACGSEDGTGTDSQVPAFIDIAADEIALTEPAETFQLEVTVRNANGDPLPDALVTFTTSAGGVASVSPQGLVQGLGDGQATVTISSGLVSKAVLIDVAIAAVALEDGVPVTDLDGPTLGHRYYTFDVPPGSQDQVLLVRLRGGTGDADLVMRRDGRPVPGAVDCLSASDPNVLDNLEFCAIPSPEAGTWHLLIYAYQAYAGVGVDAQLAPLVDLTAGVSVPDLSADEYDLLFFRLAVPQVDDLSLATTGGTGDLALFASPERTVAITDVGDLPCVSAGEGTDESCSVTQAVGGTWLVFLLAFEAFEGVVLEATLASGG
jgi:hypothetical protein